jgi:CheY-like chemotaxis protein
MTEQRKPRILVVDDDDFQHRFVERILGQVHCELAFACSGEEALQQLALAPVDLILMDVQMPGMDGLETTRKLKSMPHLAGVPVLMVSGGGEAKIVAQCLEAGAVDFVVKPFDRVVLPGKVAALLEPPAAMVKQGDGNG